MSQAYQLFDPVQRGPSKGKEAPETDWTKCVLCETVTSEALQCPAESKRRDVSTGHEYSTFAEKIARFQELKDLPMSLDLRRLDEGSGIENTLTVNKAKWHKYCLSKFSAARLYREQKRGRKPHQILILILQPLENTPVKAISRMSLRRMSAFSVRRRLPQNCFIKHLLSAYTHCKK